ncbi:carboxyl-terminal-processing peptidase 1, chloroplastic-like [Camellia sinensis]|uniref:carboxyl-terminal-processing peptidase 1, chloroplastic-like n=1 Tax=Camellia sinensis TaxID=4442 RepID=UPI001036D509|nr:carboxyl-terminal-processing peptidase 1, chloroplastic-like [Camellia sinensis]
MGWISGENLPSKYRLCYKVKHGNCGPVQSIEVQRQLVARTPVLYRLEQIDSGDTSVGYVRLKEFNALARKDLLIDLLIIHGSSTKFGSRPI